MNIKKIINNKKGLTLVEVLIVVGITAILIVSGVGIYGNLLFTTQLDESSSQTVQMLRIARERSMAGFNDSRHGVYFNINPTGDDSVILYQGSSYALRDAEYDRVLNLRPVFQISSTLTGPGNDVNFTKSFGRPDNTGTIILTHDEGRIRTITINSFGLVQEE